MCTLLNLLYIHIITHPHCSIRWCFVLAVYHKVKLIHLKEMPELTAFITDTVVMLSHLKHCLYMKRISSCSLSSCQQDGKSYPSCCWPAAFSYLEVASVVLITFFPLSKTKRISKLIRWFQTESVSEAWMHQYTSSQVFPLYLRTKPLTPYSEGICFVMLKEEFCWHDLSPSSCPFLEGKVTSNQYEVVQSDHLYPIIKHFCPAGGGLLLQQQQCPHPSAEWYWYWYPPYRSAAERFF